MDSLGFCSTLFHICRLLLHVLDWLLGLPYTWRLEGGKFGANPSAICTSLGANPSANCTWICRKFGANCTCNGRNEVQMDNPQLNPLKIEDLTPSKWPDPTPSFLWTKTLQNPPNQPPQKNPQKSSKPPRDDFFPRGGFLTRSMSRGHCFDLSCKSPAILGSTIGIAIAKIAAIPVR